MRFVWIAVLANIPAGCRRRRARQQILSRVLKGGGFQHYKGLAIADSEASDCTDMLAYSRALR